MKVKAHSPHSFFNYHFKVKQLQALALFDRAAGLCIQPRKKYFDLMENFLYCLQNVFLSD